MTEKTYQVTARGVNSQGNSWDNRYYGPGQSNDNPYHYSNRDGSYYYSNSDGSRYYNDGKGQSRYEPPPAIDNGAGSTQGNQSREICNSEQNEVEKDAKTGGSEEEIEHPRPDEPSVKHDGGPYADHDDKNDTIKDEYQGYYYENDHEGVYETYDDCNDYDQEDHDLGDYEQDGGDNDGY